MPDIATLFIFASAAFVLNATPGPSILYVISHSLAGGRTAGYASAFGLATGSAFHVILNALGISYLFIAYPNFYIVVKFFGAAYLLYLGYAYLIHSRKNEEFTVREDRISQIKMFSLYKKAIAVEFLNPKTALFYISMLPAFVDQEKGNIALQMIMLGLCVPITALFVDVTVSYFSDMLKQRVLAKKIKNKYHEVFSGILLIVLAGYIFFS